MNPLEWMALVMGSAAVGCDLSRRKIPNFLCGFGLAAALLWRCLETGLRGLAIGLAGALVGFGMLLIFYLMGGMGAGDVKLMASFGAILGPGGTAIAGLLAAILGGLAAVGWLVWNRRARAIPYGPAIVLGSWLALLARR